MHRPALLALLSAGLIAATIVIPAQGAPGAPDFSVPAARDTDPVVLTGKDLLAGGSQWSVPENLTAAIPSKDLVTCNAPGAGDCFNHYEAPDADSSTVTGDNVKGTPTDKILGYRWHPSGGQNGGNQQHGGEGRPFNPSSARQVRQSPPPSGSTQDKAASSRRDVGFFLRPALQAGPFKQAGDP